MESLNKLFTRIKSYVTTISWIFVIIETAVALAFGGLFGAHLGSDKSYTGPLWALGITYFLLLIAKLSTQRLFPSAVIEELHSRNLLDETKKQLSRRDVVSGFITESITALNQQTCAITNKLEQELCSEAVSTGLARVIDPLITRPQYLFDCNESRFTVAAFVSHNSPPPQLWSEHFIIFRDDLEIGDMLTQQLISDQTAGGSTLDLQKVLQRCYNDNQFVCDTFRPQNEDISLAASPIPLVCETTESNGILLFAYPCGHGYPKDVDNSLRIFGRIIANWLFKYSECVVAKDIASFNGTAPPYGPPENREGDKTSLLTPGPQSN